MIVVNYGDLVKAKIQDDNKEQSQDDKLKSIGAFKNKSNVADKKKWFRGYNTVNTGQVPGSTTF